MRPAAGDEQPVLSLEAALGAQLSAAQAPLTRPPRTAPFHKLDETIRGHVEPPSSRLGGRRHRSHQCTRRRTQRDALSAAGYRRGLGGHLCRGAEEEKRFDGIFALRTNT